MLSAPVFNALIKQFMDEFRELNPVQTQE